MHFSEYQQRAAETSHLELRTPDGKTNPEGLINALLGLAHEAGSILNIEKKHRTKVIDREANPSFLSQELGDLLWFLAAAATACGLELDEIASSNIARALDIFGLAQAKDPLEGLPILDAKYDPTERFPRHMLFEFTEYKQPNGRLTASLKLIDAHPNAFPQGPIKKLAKTPDGTVEEKDHGFILPTPLGANLTDNSRREDGYRFHDAIHMGFMAVLGWSPTMRSGFMLQLKRRSDEMTDEAEDGARAIYAEEGLSAILSRMAEERGHYISERNIDEHTLSVVRHATMGLEVERRLPLRLWKRAINQGFVTMQSLVKNGGGYVVADLDQRVLAYKKIRP